MKGGRLKRLLAEDNCSLLRSYENHEVDMNDLQIMTNFKKSEIRYTINKYFHDSIERRIDNKLQMEAQIEHNINMGFPVDIFKENISLIKHHFQNQSLLRFIQRLIDNHEIEVDLIPITGFKFQSIINRIKIKYAIVQNMNNAKPLPLKTIAKSNDVSPSFVFKINRLLNQFDPINTSLDGRIGDKIERLYNIHLKMQNGITMTDIQTRYNISINDVRMIKKIFVKINKE
ncbi:hypothetical protein [Staphylococcus pettenkoferi]|uniref:hypothetical protein n=2 Tax=Bacilli TaxID=91061 RepID=UPI0025572926|nr:hypothetical protein [Staphylococcus pettenkoferi]MDK7284305.1 hypothetical protein [Staphylococcus pettenkoferi]